MSRHRAPRTTPRVVVWLQRLDERTWWAWWDRRQARKQAAADADAAEADWIRQIIREYENTRVPSPHARAGEGQGAAGAVEPGSHSPCARVPVPAADLGVSE